MTSIQDARYKRCIEFLRQMARPIDETVGHVHWLDARETDTDQGPSYCAACGSKEIEKLNAAHPEHDYFLAGGYGYESDGQEFCECCGCFLHTLLTDCGIESEVENFNGVRLNLRGKWVADEAYSLLRIFECICFGDPGTYLREYQRERVKKNQRDVHKLAKRIDGIRTRRNAAILAKGGDQGEGK